MFIMCLPRKIMKKIRNNIQRLSPPCQKIMLFNTKIGIICNIAGLETLISIYGVMQTNIWFE